MVFRILQFGLISLAITLTGAVVLILSQRPKPLSGSAGLDLTATLAQERDTPQPLSEVSMRDGFPLQVRSYESTAADQPLLVLVPKTGHLDSVDAPQTTAAIESYLNDL